MKIQEGFPADFGKRNMDHVSISGAWPLEAADILGDQLGGWAKSSVFRPNFVGNASICEVFCLPEHFEGMQLHENLLSSKYNYHGGNKYVKYYLPCRKPTQEGGNDKARAGNKEDTSG